MAADCKSAAPSELRRFESSPVHQLFWEFRADVAQLVEHSLGKGEVTGSIPVISSRICDGDWLGRIGGSNSVVESQPSKLLVAGSIPVSRSMV